MTLIAQYKLDEGPADNPTTAVDSSGHVNNHDATYQYSGPLTYGCHVPGGAFGTYCLWKAWMGAAASGWAKNAGNVADLRLTGEMTVLAWVNLFATNGSYPYQVLACVSGNYWDETQAHNVLWMLAVADYNKIRAYWEMSTGTDVVADSSAGIVPGGRWSHIGFRRVLHSGGPNFDVDYFVNGVLIETNTNGGSGFVPPDGGSSSDLCIHNWGPTAQTGQFCQTYLSGVRIYDNVVSDSDILAVYNAEKSGLDIPATLIGVPLEQKSDTFQHGARERSNNPSQLANTFKYGIVYAGTLGIGMTPGYSEEP